MVSANTYIRASLSATAHMAGRRFHHLDILPAQLEILHRCASLRRRVLTDHGTLSGRGEQPGKSILCSTDFKMLSPWPEIMDMIWRKDCSLFLGQCFTWVFLLEVQLSLWHLSSYSATAMASGLEQDLLNSKTGICIAALRGSLKCSVLTVVDKLDIQAQAVKVIDKSGSATLVRFC